MPQYQMDDPLFPEQWALRALQAEAAWRRLAEVDRRPVTVAIVDWGIQGGHQDLDQRDGMVIGARVIPPDNGDFSDDSGHGTMLAGIIGAVHNNSTGVAGVAPDVKLLAAKFIDVHTPLTASNAAAAM